MDNTKVSLSKGYGAELKAYITGKEKRYITDSFLEDAEISNDGKFKMAPGRMHEADDRAIKTVVVSLDGPTVKKDEAILDQVLNLPMDVYDELIKAINDITSAKKKE